MGHPNTGPWHALLDLALNTRHNHHHMSALESICVLLRTLRCHGVIVCCKIYGDSKKDSVLHTQKKRSESSRLLYQPPSLCLPPSIYLTTWESCPYKPHSWSLCWPHSRPFWKKPIFRLSWGLIVVNQLKTHFVVRRSRSSSTPLPNTQSRLHWGHDLLLFRFSEILGHCQIRHTDGDTKLTPLRAQPPPWWAH